MKTVIDTNVFISGIFWSGSPHDILNLWQQQKITLCISPDILTEYTRVAHLLAKKHTGINIEVFLELVTIHAELFPNSNLSKAISRDPDDDKFIACAVTAKSNILISGDKDLLEVGQYKNVKILTPKYFLTQYLP